MRSSFFWAVAGIGLLLAPASLNAAPRSRTADVEQIMAPAGFDDNDILEVVLYGHYPNSCFDVGSTSFTIDRDKRAIVIDATVVEHNDRVCAQAIVPYIIPVRLGQVEAGNWQVSMLHQPNISTIVTVTPAPTEQQDDDLFAPISEARLVSLDGEQFVTLEGIYPYMIRGCMRLREVRTFVSPREVLVVLPIADMLREESCQGEERAFKRSFKLPEPFAGGLLHVRSLGGQSIDRLTEDFDAGL